MGRVSKRKIEEKIKDKKAEDARKKGYKRERVIKKMGQKIIYSIHQTCTWREKIGQRGQKEDKKASHMMF